MSAFEESFRNGWKAFEAPGVEPVFGRQNRTSESRERAGCSPQNKKTDAPLSYSDRRFFFGRIGEQGSVTPGVEPVFLDQDQAIHYAKGRACFRSGEIRIVDSGGNVERTIVFSEADRKL